MVVQEFGWWWFWRDGKFLSNEPIPLRENLWILWILWIFQCFGSLSISFSLNSCWILTNSSLKPL